MIGSLFPESVHTVTAAGDADPPPLPPDEELCLRRFYTLRRVRRCRGARAGVIWGIGVDVERAHPLGPEVVKLICSAQEREWSREVAPPDSTDWPKLIFSAKEAAYKCLAPWCKRTFGFHDLEITFQPADGRFAIRFLAEAPFPHPDRVQVDGRFATSATHVFTAVLLTAHGIARACSRSERKQAKPKRVNGDRDPVPQARRRGGGCGARELSLPSGGPRPGSGGRRRAREGQHRPQRAQKSQAETR